MDLESGYSRLGLRLVDLEDSLNLESCLQVLRRQLCLIMLSAPCQMYTIRVTTEGINFRTDFSVKLH